MKTKVNERTVFVKRQKTFAIFNELLKNLAFLSQSILYDARRRCYRYHDVFSLRFASTTYLINRRTWYDNLLCVMVTFLRRTFPHIARTHTLQAIEIFPTWLKNSEKLSIITTISITNILIFLIENNILQLFRMDKKTVINSFNSETMGIDFHKQVCKLKWKNHSTQTDHESCSSITNHTLRT